MKTIKKFYNENKFFCGYITGCLALWAADLIYRLYFK